MQLKKIVLIVPDEIHCLFGSSSHTEHCIMETNPENILNVLYNPRDYHLDYFFEDGSIRILSIEDWEEGGSGGTPPKSSVSQD